MLLHLPPMEQVQRVKDASINWAAVASMTKQIQQIKKANLHIHLGGAWPLWYLKNIASSNDYQRLLAFRKKLKKTLSYDECFEFFQITKDIVKTNQQVEDGVVALCEEFRKDNISYAEVRTGLKGLDGSYEDYLNAVIRGIERGTTKKGLVVKLILSVRRDTTPELAEKTVALAKKHFFHVVGLDVSGHSCIGNGSQMYDILQKSGLPIVLHLGESIKETEEQQMTELKTLQPARIGHGVYLRFDAREYIENHKIPVELCLSSARMVQMIKDWHSHPAFDLIRQNRPVVICDDDPTMFSTTLSQEYAIIAFMKGYKIEFVRQMAHNAMKYRLTGEN